MRLNLINKNANNSTQYTKVKVKVISLTVFNVFLDHLTIFTVSYCVQWNLVKANRTAQVSPSALYMYIIPPFIMKHLFNINFLAGPLEFTLTRFHCTWSGILLGSSRPPTSPSKYSLLIDMFTYAS